MPDLATLAAALLPAGVGVGAADPGRPYPLMPGEVVPGAVPARLAEFSAGRHAARAALASLGHAPVAIPMAPDRSPVWPTGVVGSITHSRSACLAAVARGVRGLGIDLEEAVPLERDQWDTVLRPEEQIWLARQPEAQRGLLAKTVFSAKEAAYKAQYAVSGTLFGFDTLAVVLEGDRFAATFRHAVPGFAEGAVLPGRWDEAKGHILTAVALP